MPKQDYVTKSHFDGIVQTLNKKLDMVMEKLDWLIGKYQGHEEEDTLLNNKVSEHSDQLEVINTKLRIEV